MFRRKTPLLGFGYDGVVYPSEKRCKTSGLTQANPETWFFRQCLLLKTTIYPKNPVSLRKS
ncbi:MAG: hypothetical protein AB4080_08410 [Trichodesmium sp.]